VRKILVTGMRFDAVVLRSAPAEIVLSRIATRATWTQRSRSMSWSGSWSPWGKAPSFDRSALAQD